VLARLGDAEPAAVLAGFVSTHFPLCLPNFCSDELLAIDQALVPARAALGEPAYHAATRRGASMDENQAADYALGEFRRLAGLLAEPNAK